MENKQNHDENKTFRVRLPRQNQIIGLIDQRVGGSRMLVKCNDGKVRNCKVPGRFRRALWIREGDYVLVEPWEFDAEKGDVVYKYHPNEINSLREKGYLKEIDNAL
ncbi:MAG: translation initiation factor aIF-1A [Nanoarchaeota archaeon]